MCIISVVPEGLQLQEAILERMWRINSDGAGFMYAEDGKLNVVKGLMTYDAFKEAYEPHAGKKMVLHFRIKTHGALNEVNTHPFNVSDELAFVHNGTISGFGSATHSDTWHFNEELIKPLYGDIKNFLQIAQINQLLADRIGWSKLVFMNNQGHTTIINEEKGNYSTDGIWFSNESWKELSYPKSNRGHTKTVMTPMTTTPSNSGNKDFKPLSHNNSGELKRGELEQGDFFWVTHDYRNMKRGTLGMINWFTGGYLVNATLTTSEGKSEYLPFHNIDKLNVAILTKNINHLRKGDYVLLESKDGVSCCIHDPETGKDYTVHEDYLDMNAQNEPSFSYFSIPWMEDLYDDCFVYN